MDIYAKPGTKIIFTEEEVIDAQINWGGNCDPRGLLQVGGVYTVDHTEVRSQHTKLFLKEFPGKQFNTVWFDDFNEQVDAADTDAETGA